LFFIDTAKANIRSGQTSIATVYRNLGSSATMEATGQGDANARLIASAPEMLEALENLLESYSAYVDVDEVTNADIANPVDAARAALRKAKGEACD